MNWRQSIMIGVWLVLLTLNLALAQRPAPQSADIEKAINDIFQVNTPTPPPPPATPAPPTRRPGFDVVVTPAPADPSRSQPVFNSVSGKSCTCVPYHMCDPSTMSVTQDGDFETFPDIDLRFQSDDPVCEAVLDICCDANRARNTSLTPAPLQTKRGCGIRNVGGIDFSLTGATQYEAGFGEFPWTVGILHLQSSDYFCAGSLIHPRVVLTAVHCVVNRTANAIKIRAGEWDSKTTSERLPYQERTVSRIINHPQYNFRNAANDFSLLILSSAVELDDHINTICLPPSSSVPTPNTRCIATGWGKNQFGAKGVWSNIIKHIPLPIVGFNECQAAFRRTRLGPKFNLDRSFICAGGEPGIDTCQGDGGAPLFCPVGPASENQYEQAGIVAWGIGCNENIPAAYANVPLARNWIDEQMFANGFDTSAYSIS